MAVTNEEKRYLNLMNAAPAQSESAATRQAAAALAAQERATQGSDYIPPGKAQVTAKATQNADNYSTTADGRLDEAIAGYLNKNGYRYDINNDDAYRAFAQERAAAAQRGRELSRAGAESLAGGYQPSYADTVAGEIYNDQVSRTGEYQPQFEALAASENAARQRSDQNLVDIYSNLAQTEYGRNRDAYNDKTAYMNYLAEKYNTERQADVTAAQNAASIYGTRLQGAVSDLTDARTMDEKRTEHNTVSADTAAKIRESDYEAALKLRYQKAKDAYSDRVAAAKAEAAAAKAKASEKKAAKTAAAKKVNAEAKAKKEAAKAATTAKINKETIKDYLNGSKKKLTPEERVKLDYNGDGKVDTKDLVLAQREAESQDVLSGKSIKLSAAKNLNDIVINIREMSRSEGYKNGKTIKQVAKQYIEKHKDELTTGESGFLYEYFGLA